MKVKCPTCQKEIEWNENNPFRPFCSERCRLIDLGDWANETHRIPSNEPVSEDALTKNENEFN
jgi:endogenous inhibitor of DNA gyrase (YacG/DUF329 family)